MGERELGLSSVRMIHPFTGDLPCGFKVITLSSWFLVRSGAEFRAVQIVSTSSSVSSLWEITTRSWLPAVRIIAGISSALFFSAFMSTLLRFRLCSASPNGRACTKPIRSTPFSRLPSCRVAALLLDKTPDHAKLDHRVFLPVLESSPDSISCKKAGAYCGAWHEPDSRKLFA